MSFRRAIELQRYPLHDPGAPAYRVAVEQAKADLEATGYARLSGFLTPQAVAQMAREATARLDQVDRTIDHHNPYFSEPADDLPPGDPRAIFATRSCR